MGRDRSCLSHTNPSHAQTYTQTHIGLEYTHSTVTLGKLPLLRNLGTSNKLLAVQFTSTMAFVVSTLQLHTSQSRRKHCTLTGSETHRATHNSNTTRGRLAGASFAEHMVEKSVEKTVGKEGHEHARCCGSTDGTELLRVTVCYLSVWQTRWEMTMPALLTLSRSNEGVLSVRVDGWSVLRVGYMGCAWIPSTRRRDFYS